jgi:NADH-quinone oxidoreductase subunit M
VPALSILIWLPLASGLLGGLLSGALHGRAATRVPGALALAGAVATLGLAIGYIADYDTARGGLQHVTDVVWISDLGIHYKLAVDGLNVALLGLTALLFAAATLAANLRSWARPGLFYFHLMLAESAVLGAFSAQDLALFVAFFDLMLVPFYFLMSGWGRSFDGDERTRSRATLKLVIYTLVGSLLMLAAAVATGVLAQQEGGGHITFVLSELQRHTGLLSAGAQDWIFLGFAAAFLVKMPAFPLHGWMPDGYRAMPIEVLMVFSGVLSKVGAYGFLAIVLPLFPHAARHFQTLMLLVALVSIIYGSLLAFSQRDARLIAGYSSIAQLGFITLGIFSLTSQGAQGALLQMVNHGLVVAPILFIVALLAQRAGGSEDIADMGGIAMRAPLLASVFLIVTLATLAIPGSGNFVGEFLILLGTFEAKLAIAIVASSGVVLASVYALRLYIRSMHNRVGPRVQSRELGRADAAVLIPLVAVIVFMAVYPQLALHRSESAVKESVAPAHAGAVTAQAGSLTAQAAARTTTAAGTTSGEGGAGAPGEATDAGAHGGAAGGGR